MTVLQVQAVGKAFKEYASIFHQISSWLGVPVRARKETWVLRNISFTAGAGEAVGIVGQNGAGKSTLLKLVAGTTEPTRGALEVRGRVAAILELGMGFNPELTGRQNAIYVLGLMGYLQTQIMDVMPWIEEFAEVGDYFDQPVRMYSSGMQMRVAFSVATAFTPEILIIDEALAVGDTYFQHKSFGRIREFQRVGTTLLIVSHDRSSIQALCDRAILLDKGCVLRDGDPEEVMDFYNALIAEKENSSIRISETSEGKKKISSGTGEVCTHSIKLMNTQGEECDYFSVGEKICLEVVVRVCMDIESLVLGYGIKDHLGQVIFGTNTWHTGQTLLNPVEGDSYKYSVVFPANLGVGSYSIQTALVDRDTHLTSNYEWTDLAVVFNVVNTDKNIFVGSSWIEPTIQVTGV